MLMNDTLKNTPDDSKEKGKKMKRFVLLSVVVFVALFIAYALFVYLKPAPKETLPPPAPVLTEEQQRIKAIMDAKPTPLSSEEQKKIQAIMNAKPKPITAEERKRIESIMNAKPTALGLEKLTQNKVAVSS